MLLTGDKLTDASMPVTSYVIIAEIAGKHETFSLLGKQKSSKL
ncbi:hypothetical protein [Paraglaciecola sp.]